MPKDKRACMVLPREPLAFRRCRMFLLLLCGLKNALFAAQVYPGRKAKRLS